MKMFYSVLVHKLSSVKYSYLVIAIFFIGACAGIGSTLVYQSNRSVPPVVIEEKPSIQRLTKQFKFTNPLLECDLYPKINGAVKPFEDKLNNYIQTSINNKEVSQVSVYYRDLVNGPWIGINEKNEFSPASLLKVPLMMSILRIADKKPEFLDEPIVFQKKFDNPRSQKIVPIEELVVNKSYTVKELLDHMIVYSDNDAASVLASSIPQTDFFKPYQELNVKEPRRETTEYYIDVVKYGSFFRILYNSTFLSQENSEFALSLLAKTAYKDGLVAGVPENIKVSHKFGERQWEDTNEEQLHDCGIVYHPTRPYILCVMTKGEDIQVLSKVIANISRITYKQVNEQTQE